MRWFDGTIIFSDNFDVIYLNFTANVGLGKWSLVGMLDVFFIGDGRNLHPSVRDCKSDYEFYTWAQEKCQRRLTSAVKNSPFLCFNMCNIVLISLDTDVSKLSSCLESLSMRWCTSECPHCEHVMTRCGDGGVITVVLLAITDTGIKRSVLTEQTISLKYKCYVVFPFIESIRFKLCKKLPSNRLRQIFC
jgi:hypothetical protein